MTDENTVVVSFAVESGPVRSVVREIAKVGRAGLDEPVRVRIPLTPRSTWTADPLSDGFVVTGKEWWYATLDDRDGEAATTFVRADGSTATYPRPAPAGTTTDMTRSNSWQLIAIPGEKPRVLELTYAPEETVARELDFGGASRLWHLPPEGQALSRMVALPLADGRIALLSNHRGLSLYLLADDGHVDVVPLRNVLVQQFDAALDGAGHVVIVAARNAIVAAPNDSGAIEAAIIDPSHPEHAEWSSLRHGVRVIANGQYREVQVVRTPDGFAAAWVNELGGRRIEAASIDRRGHGGPVVEVGRLSQGDVVPFLGVQAKDDQLLFWWDDGKQLFQRRLPASLTGYAFLTDFAQAFCGAPPTPSSPTAAALGRPIRASPDRT